MKNLSRFSNTARAKCHDKISDHAFVLCSPKCRLLLGRIDNITSGNPPLVTGEAQWQDGTNDSRGRSWQH